MALLLMVTGSFAQKQSSIQLNNYSTSYAARTATEPFVLTAIPYNGKYNVADEIAPLDLSISTSDTWYRAHTENYRQLNTYDSSEVYFYAPNIFASNAGLYEYRVMKNRQDIITDWSNITKFTDGDLQLQTFKKNFAMLGGYKTAWDNYITVELRKKGTTKILSAALVYWKQIKPVLLNVYTGNELNEFLYRMKHAYETELTENEIKKWEHQYAKNEIDSNTHIPKKLTLQPNENSLIFYLKGDIYKKDALEYQLEKDGKIITPWKPNDFDNNVIWLNGLQAGDYKLHMRYSGQRHNESAYPFEIKPAWHQTTFFKIISGSLIAVFFSFFVVLFALRAQRRKTAQAQSKKEKLNLELKAIHSQLNPHFVFNALTSIQGLINNNNITGANKYLSQFGSLMRGSLTAGDKDFISLDKEIAMLETYLSLEQLRFGFGYKIELAENINPSATEIPALLLQPLVENAVKHGVSGLAQNGYIMIKFAKENNDMQVTIFDNGKGFTPVENSNGYGLKLTKERIKLLNEMLQGQVITMEILPAVNNGMNILLTFKNWL